jgi:hypothetical protein
MYISGGEEQLWNSHQSGNDIPFSAVLEIGFKVCDAKNRVTCHRLRKSGNSKIQDVRDWIIATATSHNSSLESNEVINAVTYPREKKSRKVPH